MPAIAALANANYNNTTRVSNWISWSLVEAFLPRLVIVSTDYTDPADTITITVEWSPDGGQTARHWMTLSSVGAVDRNSKGGLNPTALLCNPPPGITDVRVTVTVAGRVRFGVDVEY